MNPTCIILAAALSDGIYLAIPAAEEKPAPKEIVLEVTHTNHWPQISMTWQRFTNVVTGDNHRGCPHRNTTTEIAPGIFSTTLLYHPYHEGCFPYVPPTERWTITTIGIRHTATIWGFPGELTKEDIISCVTNREVLESKWVTPSQKPAPPPEVTATNIFIQGSGMWTNQFPTLEFKKLTP